ncbi:MAG: hypothetical protein ACOX8I_10700 [Bacillota bacterium]|jgi:hypothetical protein
MSKSHMKKWPYILAIIVVISAILILAFYLKPWSKPEDIAENGDGDGDLLHLSGESIQTDAGQLTQEQELDSLAHFDAAVRASQEELAKSEEVQTQDMICNFDEYSIDESGDSAFWTLIDFRGDKFALWQPFSMGDLNPSAPVTPQNLSSGELLRVYSKTIKYADGFEIDIITGYEILESFDPELYDSYVRSANREIDFSQVQMTDFFPWPVGYNSAYIGSLDYERSFKVENIIDAENERRIVFRNMMWGENDEQRLFNTEMIITSDQIVDLEDNFILLKKPLQVGTEWENKVVLSGKEYIGVTRITEFVESAIITETHVSGIPEFSDRTLYRRQAFEPGQGVICTLQAYPYDGYFTIYIWKSGFISEWEDLFYYLTDEEEENAF